MHSIIRLKWPFTTIAFTAFSIAVISCTGCGTTGTDGAGCGTTGAEAGSSESTAVTAADRVMETNEMTEGGPPEGNIGGNDHGREQDLPDPATPLTLDRVLELAEKGDALSWDDLAGYAQRDVGSGLYILHFEIDDQFFLLMGGAGPDSPPMYVRLVSVQDEDLYIDIREEDVQSFIDRVLAGGESGTGGTDGSGSGAGGTGGVGSGTTGTGGSGYGTTGTDGSGYGTTGAEAGHEDLLLTSAPALCLQDALSSTLSCFEVPAGSYSWNVTVPGTDQGTGIVACGMGPLAAAAMETVPRLTLPRYQGMDQVLYTFDTRLPPDSLTVRQWDSQAAQDPDTAKEQAIVTCYPPFSFLELESGKIYEVFAEWEEGSAGQNGFYGTASYVFVTE